MNIRWSTTTGGYKSADARGKQEKRIVMHRTGCIAGAVTAWVAVASSSAHIFIFPWQRAGTAPCYRGQGWHVECFYDLPDNAADNLLTAEQYIRDKSPTFTFHADYIDWPAGERVNDLDTSFATMGDFLNDYVSDFSDPGAPSWPFRHFLLRATGYFIVDLNDAKDPFSPPIRKDYGLFAYDGGRVRIDTTTIFRIVVPIQPESFYFEDGIFPSPGLYQIEVTFFQRYNPGGTDGTEYAGVELRTCQQDGLDLPGQDYLPCPEGQGTAKGTPPRLIYRADDILPDTIGDFDADNDVDLYDFSRFQRCFTASQFEGEYEAGCEKFDLDGDDDVDIEEYALNFAVLTGALWCDR